ncbi:MAG: DinB family protein, partial [Dehalococcoidia bacterium]
MEGAALIADALGRVNQILHRSLAGVSADTLCKMPSPETNSIAWLAWHLTRVQDHHMSDLAGLPQLWTSGGWHARFGMAEDDQETGTGHTPQQV